MKNLFSSSKGLESLRESVGSKVLYVGISSAAVMLILSIIWGIRSCTNKDYDFSNNEEAIAFYRSYLKDVHAIATSDGKSFCNEINKWSETRDTIISYLAKDSSFTSHSPLYLQFQNINDSIRQEFVRLTETWKCSFNDVILIKEGTTPFRNDKEIMETSLKASAFFNSLDTIKITKHTKDVAINTYRTFLANTESRGIASWNDVQRFLILEDVCFRGFLNHLYELDNDHISDITEKTERICRQIFVKARDGNLNKKDVITYMSMRTVRRLLQNSTVCVNDIKVKKMKSEMQANAYLWMIIQPFVSIDQLAIATITPEGRDNLKYIADQLPKSSSFAKAFNIDQKALSYLLPQQLLKMYVLSL